MIFGSKFGAIAVGVICKTPMPGRSKTRLCPPLTLQECAEISACFISDLNQTIADLAREGGVTQFALYTPLGSESHLRRLLPEGVRLIPQTEGDLGARLFQGLTEFIAAGYDGAILINSDSPTLPKSILAAAVDSLRRGADVVLSPALDGGYTLVGMCRPQRQLFENIAWSTSIVFEQTLSRARRMGLTVVTLPMWYDVDDQASLEMLKSELAGQRPFFAVAAGSNAPSTQRFLAQHLNRSNAADASISVRRETPA